MKNLSASAGDAGGLGSIPGSEDPLGKGMATHPSILAWGIPWTEEPGGLVQAVPNCWTRLSDYHFHFPSGASGGA